MKRVVWLFVMVIPLLGLNACSNVGSANNAQSPFIANFDPANNVIPFPNNILFLSQPGFPSDGTLNIPVVDPADFTDPKVAMNTLDGFSTSAPITTTFNAAIAPASIDIYSVHLYQVGTIPATAINPLADPYATIVTSITAELTQGVDYLALPSPSDSSTLVLKPLKPLVSNSQYMVTLTNGLTNTAGAAAVEDFTFSFLKQTTSLVDPYGNSLIPADNASAQQLEGLRGLTQAMLGAVAGLPTPINPANVVMTWTFKTQTLNQVLPAIQADSATNPYSAATNFISFPVIPSSATNNLGVLDIYSFVVANDPYATAGLQDAYAAGSFNNLASVVIGAVNLPYYLDDNSVNPLGPVTGTFQFNPGSSLPITKSVQTAPFLLTVPNTAGPWPVVIFQHGFTVDKSVVFGIANTLAKAGFATIAIDAVLHGDRTFDLDLVNNTTGAAGPDGLADPSGTHYLNLGYLLTARDNVRQSVADLIHLTRLIENQAMDVVNNATGLPGSDTTPDLRLVPGVAGFVGHSNGGILGTMLAAVEPGISTFVLANPGGVYSDIFQNSVEISPKVNAGLSAKGVSIGSPDYFAFLAAAQTVADDADPFNYAAAAAAKNILLFKQLGDLVVPNASTDLLSGALGLPQVATSTAAVDPVTGVAWPLGVNVGLAPTGFAGSGFTFFTQGTHSSFLKPDPPLPSLTGLDVITEMQSETANYLGSALLGGATVVIGATPLPSTNAASTVVQ